MVNTSFTFNAFNKVIIKEVHYDDDLYNSGSNDSMRYLVFIDSQINSVDDLSPDEFYSLLGTLAKSKTSLEEYYANRYSVEFKNKLKQI
jgi:hypothetical protein